MSRLVICPHAELCGLDCSHKVPHRRDLNCTSSNGCPGCILAHTWVGIDMCTDGVVMNLNEGNKYNSTLGVGGVH